jgi:DNA-binding CsgD family transcriptional regulator
MTKFNFDDLIKSLYGSLIDPDGFKPFLSKLIEQCNFRSGALIMANMETRDVNVIWMDGLELENLQLFMERLDRKDPLIEKLVKADPGSLIIAGDATREDARINEPEFYRDWICDLDIHYAAGAVLTIEGSWVSQMVFQRRHDQGMFLPDETDMLKQLIPHMQHAMHLHHIKVDQDKQRLLSQLLFDQIQQPVILLDNTNNVCHCNQKANAFLSKSMPLKVINRRLHNIKSNKNTEINLAIDTCRANKSTQTIHIKTENNHTLALTFAPLVKDSTSIENGIAIFIYNSEQTPSLDLQTLRDLFDLSDKEGKVCCELVNGRSPAEIADLHYLTYETVRTYIKRIMRKTSTSRQNELVAKLMSSPAFYPITSPLDI